jgi:hypothetical protein
MHITIPVQPLLVCQTNETLDKFCTPIINGPKQIVLEKLGLIKTMSEYGI